MIYVGAFGLGMLLGVLYVEWAERAYYRGKGRG